MFFITVNSNVYIKLHFSVSIFYLSNIANLERNFA